MYSSEGTDGIFSADNPIEESESREVGELESWHSMKILRTEEPGWFAPWFNLVGPDQTIHEDEYFWRTGQPLNPDNWANEDQLDHYLGLDKPKEPVVEDEDEEESGFPLTLSLDLSDDESDYDSAEIVRDDESVISSEVGYTLAAPQFDRAVSDWTKMPPPLPKLPSAVVEVQPKELTREKSDWTKLEMPKLLPPLNKMSSLEPPSMQPQVSDWSVMPPLMAPLPSDPSQYHHVPNVVPMAPQISWETSDPRNVATPMWLQDNTNPNFHQDFMARPSGLEFASIGASQREMEILSDAPQPIMTAPVLHNGYENGYSLQPTGVMAAPTFHPQPALVHFPFITLAGSII